MSPSPRFATIAAACLTLASLVAVGCAGAPTVRDRNGTAEAALRALTPQQLWSRMHDARKLMIFDNNRPETYALGRVPGAVALALSGDIAARLPADKDVTLVFYCSNEH